MRRERHVGSSVFEPGGRHEVAQGVSPGIRGTVLAVFLALLWTTTAVAALEVPYLAGRVNDLAGLLSPQTVQGLESRLEQLEQATGAQVVVLTLASLEDEALDDFSMRVVETWELGRKDVDDGVLLLVSRDDRKVRIEVGYGLEPTLTDVRSRRIISNLLVPRFREADFDGGITAAVEAIDATVRGQEDLIPPGLMDSGDNDLADATIIERLIFLGVFAMVVGTFSLVSVSSSGCTGWAFYFFLMPFYFSFPAAAFGPTAGAIALGLWVIAFPALRYWLGTGAGKSVISRFPGSSGWSGGGWSSDRRSGGGWSGGGFSGGFSGGGGSFGGGGASGSW